MSTTASSATDWQQLVEEQDTKALARLLQHDQELCAAGDVPSPLAFRLAGIPQTLADEIGGQLLAEHGTSNIPLSIQRIQFKEVVAGIKGHVQQLNRPSTEIKADATTEHKFASVDLETALRVLQTLINTKDISSDRPISDAVSAIQSHLDKPVVPLVEQASENVPTKIPHRRTCYICFTGISKATCYPDHPSLCLSCGAFNLCSSELSLPCNLLLDKKSALVTGGRVNHGFHTALRLLRCGARVLVTTRYPRDAEKRYRQQPDFHQWESRLRIIGADFRTSRDVFRLAKLVKQVLMTWSDGVPHLDILINNAAQTLTDSIATERKAIAQEMDLRTLNEPSQILVEYDKDYIPRVRGGTQSLASELISREEARSLAPGVPQISTIASPFGISLQNSKRPQSSWTQTLPEIPYEDVISAHSVNTFVPLILIRELLPLMGTTASVDNPPKSEDDDDPTTLEPAGYIINVSSREGIFDSLSSGSSQLRKARYHVHTNMSKAALNMITETEAAACWHDGRVCMNSVDPGYMSAAPGFGRDLPLGWEDGAGRVLWPVAVGWAQQDVRTGSGERAVWGKFLKHYHPSRWGGESF